MKSFSVEMYGTTVLLNFIYKYKVKQTITLKICPCLVILKDHLYQWLPVRAGVSSDGGENRETKLTERLSDFTRFELVRCWGERSSRF